MFDAYAVTIEMIRELAPVVCAIEKRDPKLGDQIRRAGSSIALNLNEGRRRSGADQRKFFRYAAGSANEVRAGLDLADAWGWAPDATKVRPLLDRVLAMLWRLTH